VAIVWSSLVAFLYDYPRSRYLRSYNFSVANDAAKVVSTNSILFTSGHDEFSGLIERGQIRIAIPFTDNFCDFPALMAFHLQNGRPAYAAFSSLQWEAIKKRGLVDRFKIIPIEFNDSYILSELVMK
jgi:hypothetical protein